MSISPAQLALQLAAAESSVAPRAPNAKGSSDSAGSSAASTPSSAPSSPSPADQLTGDLKFDDQHQMYYEVVDKSTGSVLFEIPPEALRKLSESLNQPALPNGSAGLVDLKS